MTTATDTRPRNRAGTRNRTRPRLTGRPRRLVRAAHVVAAGGWVGLVIAMLTLGAVATSQSADADPSGTYRLMHVVGGRVIPPVAVVTLGTGLALSLLTPWGLVRHWWVAIKIAIGLAVIGTAITLTDTWLEQAAASPTGDAGTRLVVTSVVHLAVLTFATVISVDKPWGRTPRGRHRT